MGKSERKNKTNKDAEETMETPTGKGDVADGVKVGWGRLYEVVHF
jgi:hypothetical protein